MSDVSQAGDGAWYDAAVCHPLENFHDNLPFDLNQLANTVDETGLRVWFDDVPVDPHHPRATRRKAFTDAVDRSRACVFLVKGKRLQSLQRDLAEVVDNRRSADQSVTIKVVLLEGALDSWNDRRPPDIAEPYEERRITGSVQAVADGIAKFVLGEPEADNGCADGTGTDIAPQLPDAGGTDDATVPKAQAPGTSDAAVAEPRAYEPRQPPGAQVAEPRRDDQSRAVDAAEQRELRLALVMTGGVSLAVWMGGVAAEVYRLVRGDGVYRGLLDLTGIRVTVDVVSGSSAGGLNGALLGTALSYRLDTEKFDQLRNLWFTAGSFTELLRKPSDKNPPSLLRGDDYFTPQVRDVLRRWVEDRDPVPVEDNPLTVVLTAALLTPDLHSRADVFGVSVVEPVHRARFTFGPEQLADKQNLPARLALAARTSASFPGAFEPSFVPIGKEDASKDRPDMEGIASFSRSRWAIDGGVLMNKPVKPALDLIEAREARGDVRRIVAYVNPDPGERNEEMDVADDMPTLGDVVLSSLITLPRVESIVDDLTEIADYNKRLRKRREVRDRLVWGKWTNPLDADPDSAPDSAEVVWRQLEETAEAVYPLWVRRRVERAVDLQLAGHLSRTGFEITDRRSANGDSFSYIDLRTALEEERLRTGWLPGKPPTLAGLHGDRWEYGFTPLEYLVSMLLDIIRRSFDLLPAPAQAESSPELLELRQQLGDLRGRVHDERVWVQVLRAMDNDHYGYWLDHLDHLEVALCATDIARRIYDLWPTPPRDLTSKLGTAAPVTRKPLSDGQPSKGPAANVLTQGQAEARPDRALLTRFGVWQSVQALLRWEKEQPKSPSGWPTSTPSSEPRLKPLVATDFEPLDPLLGFQFTELQDLIRGAEMRIARHLAAGALELRPLVESVADVYRSHHDHPARAERAGRCKVVALLWEPLVLTQTLNVLTHPVDPGNASGPARRDSVLLTATRMLHVHSMIDEDASGLEVRIEFGQIAATAPNEVDQRANPADKVAGLQMGHFGGFLKESWRANDWMWGALDAAARLIPLVLDPLRLRQRFDSAADAVKCIEQLATGAELTSDEVTADERRWLTQEWQELHRDAVTKELGYLNPGPEQPVPDQLPATTRAVTRLAQLLIAARELPEVRNAIVNSTNEGADENSAASVFVEQIRKSQMKGRRLSLDSVPAALTACRVGSEKVITELGSDAGAAIATKAAAVLATAAAGSRSGLGPLRHVAGAARLPLVTTYYTALSAARRTRIGFALVTLLLAVGAGAVAARLVGGDVPDSVLVVAIAALAFWVLLTGVTAGAWRYAVGGVLLLGIIALSFIPQDEVCSVFAETCDPIATPPGWKEAVRWLVPSVLLLLGVVFCFVALRTNGRRAADAERTGQPVKLWRQAYSWLPAALLFGGAVALWLVLHDLLFTGDGTIGARGWIIEKLEGWSSANILVVLIGIPLLFMLLGYVRQAFRDSRIDRARKKAYRRQRGAQLRGAAEQGL